MCRMFSKDQLCTGQVWAKPTWNDASAPKAKPLLHWGLAQVSTWAARPSICELLQKASQEPLNSVEPHSPWGSSLLVYYSVQLSQSPCICELLFLFLSTNPISYRPYFLPQAPKTKNNHLKDIFKILSGWWDDFLPILTKCLFLTASLANHLNSSLISFSNGGWLITIRWNKPFFCQAAFGHSIVSQQWKP